MLSLVFISFILLVIVLGLPMVTDFGVAGLLPIFGGGAAYTLTDFGSWLISSTASTTYVTIALFIIAGNIMSKGQISDRVFHVFAYFLGAKRGFLPICAILTAMFYGMVSGSGIACIAAIGSLCLPMLIKVGYDRAYYGALLGAAGCLGMTIPPTNTLLEMNVLTGVETTGLFKTSMVLGLVSGAVLILMCYFHCWKDNGNETLILANHEELRREGFVKVFSNSVWAIVSPVIILGGIFSGIFSALEAAAVSVIYSSIVGVYVYKTIAWKDIWKTVEESMKAIGPLCMILAFSVSFSKVIAALGGDVLISQAVTSIITSPAVYMILSVVIFTIGGMFMNVRPLLVPIMFPIAEQLGLNPTVWCIVVSSMGSIALLTPPFGLGLYTIAPMTGEAAGKVVKLMVPFIVMLTIVSLIFGLFPQLSLWVL